MINTLEISVNRPLYIYQKPMFMITVSTVLIVENGVVVVKDVSDGKYKFPGGMVRASQETVQFSAIRQIKEQTGITLKKQLLIPVDFRSSPDRSPEGNLVDIGFVCVFDEIIPDHLFARPEAKWMEVDFEKREIIGDNISLYMDHDALLQRAIDMTLMIK